MSSMSRRKLWNGKIFRETESFQCIFQMENIEYSALEDLALLFLLPAFYCSGESHKMFEKL